MKFPTLALLAGLLLLCISQLLLSFGYDYLMDQRPVDFAHWALLLAALCMLVLWSELPPNLTKSIGLGCMTLGVAGIIGMCTLDFILWAAHGNPVKEELFGLIFGTPSIHLPFLVVGPTLFYMGIGMSTYGLFLRYKWQVVAVNVGVLLIGLGHMIFEIRSLPVVGALLVLVGLFSLINPSTSSQTSVETALPVS